MFATTSDNLAIHPVDTAHTLIIGSNATSTTGNILEVVGSALVRNALTAYDIITAPIFNATNTSATSTFSGGLDVLAINQTGSATSTFAQGINLALRDVIVAANHLIPALKNNSNTDTALAAIQAEREPEIKRSQHLQYQDTRGIGTWYAPLLIGMARHLGPIMGKYEWARNAWLNQQKDLRFGSTDVRLDV